MKRALIAILAALPLAACGAPSPEDRDPGTTSQDLRWPLDPLLNFDQVSAASPLLGTVTIYLGNGEIVDNAYSNYGVTFSCVSCTSGHAYARSSAFSGNNSVSLFAPPSVHYFDARWGAVKAEFASPRTWVSIDARPVLPPEYVGTPVAKPWIEAYDANNQLITRTYYPLNYGDAGYGTFRGLIVNAGSARIKYVRFSSQFFSNSPPVYGDFDNLLFNADPLVPIRLEKPPLKTFP